MITKSIVIPCYNEENTILDIVNKVISNITQDDEVIIVNDCSRDKTSKKLTEINKNHSQIKILNHETNLGKGAALQTAFKECKNDIIIIQDADLEYDPRDYENLLLHQNQLRRVVKDLD